MQKVIINFNKSKEKIIELFKKNVINKTQNSNNIFSSLKILKKPAKLFEFRKTKRAKDLILNEKISEINKNCKNLITLNLRNFEQKNLKNNFIISQQLKTQNSNMIKKLKSRRQHSVTISTGSSSFNLQHLQQNMCLKKSTTLKNINIIKELEYFEEDFDNLDLKKDIVFKNINKKKLKLKKNLTKSIIT